MAASLNGFFVLHTLYTWPKLSSAAFVCAAYGVWILRGSVPGARGRMIGGLLAALACLCHEGRRVPSLLPLLAVDRMALPEGEFAQWLLAGIVFAATVAPWTAYQHLYAPPGNRLLKWHLAGDYGRDDKPVGKAISDAYRDQSMGGILATKAANLGFQGDGDWAGAASASAGGADARRSDEYFHLLRAFGWWNLAFPLLLATLAARGRFSGITRLQWTTAAWALSSILVWCLLLASRPEIAHGSLAVLITLFALYALWFENAWRGCLPCIAALQAYTLATTWMPGNSVVAGPLSAAAAALIALAAAAAAAMILSMSGDETSPGGSTMPR